MSEELFYFSKEIVEKIYNRVIENKNGFFNDFCIETAKKGLKEIQSGGDVAKGLKEIQSGGDVAKGLKNNE
jgi:hypothetical protein